MVQLQETQCIYGAAEVIPGLVRSDSVLETYVFGIRNMFDKHYDVEVELFISPCCVCSVS
jgi:hypothetical protein